MKKCLIYVLLTGTLLSCKKELISTRHSTSMLSKSSFITVYAEKTDSVSRVFTVNNACYPETVKFTGNIHYTQQLITMGGVWYNRYYIYTSFKGTGDSSHYIYTGAVNSKGILPFQPGLDGVIGTTSFKIPCSAIAGASVTLLENVTFVQLKDASLNTVFAEDVYSCK